MNSALRDAVFSADGKLIWIKKKSFCLRGLNSKFVIRNHFVCSYSMFVVFVGRCSVCRTAEVHRSYHISFHCQFPCWKKPTEIKESCFVYIDSVYLNGCAVPVHHCRATLTYFFWDGWQLFFVLKRIKVYVCTSSTGDELSSNPFYSLWSSVTQSYCIVTSSVICYWTDPRQHENSAC